MHGIRKRRKSVILFLSTHETIFRLSVPMSGSAPSGLRSLDRSEQDPVENRVIIPTRPASRLAGGLRDWSVEVAFFVVMTAAGLWAAGRWFDPTGDPGVWWSLAQRMAHGQRCYRDVYLQYGPLSPYLLFVSGIPFGFSRSWFLFVNWLPALAAGILLIRASRPFLSATERLAVVGLLLGLSIFAPGPARLVFPYSPAAVQALALSVGALLLMQAQNRETSRAWASGILSGLAFCAKQEIGAAAIAGLCAPLLTRGTKGFAWVARCLVGFSAVATLGAGFVLASGASADSLRYDSHLWPLASVPAGWSGLFRLVAGMAAVDWHRNLALSAEEGLKRVLLVSLVALILGREKKRGRWVVAAGLLALLVLMDLAIGRSLLSQVQPVILSMSVAFLLAVFAWLDRKRAHREFLVGFGLFAGFAGMRAAFSSDTAGPYMGVAHFAPSLTWVLFLLCIVPNHLPGGVASARWARKIWTMLLISVAFLTAAGGIEKLREEYRIAFSTPRGRIFLEPRMAAVYALVGEQLHQGERALFLPETHSLDVLFGVEDASPLLGHMPGWLDSRAEDLLLRRFEIRPPDVVVIFERQTTEFRVAPFGRGFGAKLAAWIDARYRSTGNWRGVRILRVAEKPVSSTAVR
jgi:hypothetical protein